MSGLDSVPGMNGLFVLLACVGVGLIAVSIISIAWEKRRGGGFGGMGGSGARLGWVIVMGAVFAAPKIIIPVLLWFFEVIANFAFSLVNGALG
ncbi:MAG: hypothetical protein E6640_01635 [Actinomyces urogenitalis]|uniref:hypothetical protein n=1 Tax=Actinomyces urogenitalis TaxID=103621 RepID=UPI00290BF66C|nr:hypothetical protein [Actinomyces urogenitalis]MDU6150912.1 hypothetical protein [Actinomyces urogenitalis]